MRIYSMTATFGKLEHEILVLEPGFNILQAPNEWGKSTWCAFLVAMLYGLETRTKSTKTTLADKERYAPWSGSPMAGRIDLNWQGRDITIERKTKGRVPMGDFRAYETNTGLPVGELNGANCGQILLGVERSVFLRSGFVRLSDLPVTNDEALRRRLNALVTTGDESSAGDRLAQGLKDLKNRIRYHRSGLLPQVEAECAALEEKLEEIHGLHQQMDELRRRIETVNTQLQVLENHKTALVFEAAEADVLRIAEARQLRDAAGQHLQELDAYCAGLPEREQLQWGLLKIRELEQALEDLEMEEKLCETQISLPDAPAFAGKAEPDAVLEKAISDAGKYREWMKPKKILLFLGMVLILCGFAGVKWYPAPGLLCGAVGAAVLLTGWGANAFCKASARKLEKYYGNGVPESWIQTAEDYKTALELAKRKTEKQLTLQQNIAGRKAALEVKITGMTQGKGLRLCRQEWEQALSCWNALADAHRDWQRAENQLKLVKAMAKTASAPEFADHLSCSLEETEQLLSDAREELRQAETRLNQYAGRVEALGDSEMLKKQLAERQLRKKKLEDTYAALSVAQETLMEARLTLQRRFAPRISKRAAELMAKMTGGRYNRLQLAEDFSLLAGAEREDTLHEALWRSEGTLDQLYLSLRIAVAEALAPHAPLILDDALVRFDDTRLKAALEILKEESKEKQVILFTCQSREKEMV